MRVVFDSSESTDDFQDCIDKKASESSMFHNWKTTFDLQIPILMFIQSQRKRDFTLYVQVFKSIMNIIFTFNHYNYTQWLTIHVDDLMKLELVFPNVHKEFCSGNFFFRETINSFSAIALNQADEQNNTIITGVGSAVGLFSKDMDSALKRREVARPKVCRLLEEYERLYNITSKKSKGKHHKDYTEFQKTFFKDTQKLFSYFNEICNPFQENRLVVLDTGGVMNSDAETCLANLLERNEERYKEFYKHCHKKSFSIGTLVLVHYRDNIQQN